MTGERRYRCDQCDTRYTIGEYLELEKVPVDPDNIEKFGYHAVCNCGAEFWKDRWTTRDTIEVNETEFVVSTVALPIDHGFGNTSLWYETLVRPGGWMDRYQTQEEAEEGHREVCEKIRSGDWMD